MADAVEIAFHRAARALFDAGRRVVVAVSGGSDSIALLHLTARLSPQRRPSIVVAHLDHALRRGSTADLRLVARHASALSLPLVAARQDVRAAKRKDESLEEAARRIRRAFLIEAASEAGADVIATGHTLDDQAETILMRLVRGAGPSALAAMTPSGPGPFVKPLLDLERGSLRGWLRKRRIAFRDDPSNESLAFDRNRVRRLVLPLLTTELNPAAARHLVDAARRLRDDAALLDALAREAYDTGASVRRGVVRIPAETLAALPPPLASRLVRIALEAAGCDPRRISSRHVAAAAALATAHPGARVDLPGRMVSARRGRLVEFGRAAVR